MNDHKITLIWVQDYKNWIRHHHHDGKSPGKIPGKVTKSSHFNSPCLFCSAGPVLDNDNVPSTCRDSSTGQPLFHPSSRKSLGN